MTEKKSDTKLLIDNFNRHYYDTTHNGRRLFEVVEWMGVGLEKCPLDLWIYQEILHRTRPDLIVECGVYQGGSTLFLAHICDLLGHGQVLSIDITLEQVAPSVRAHPRIELIEASSTAPETISIVRAAAEKKRVMVILDSDHFAEHVRRELELYSPFVTPGCYLICEDTNVNGHPAVPEYGPGPFEAVQDFLAAHPEWEVDSECERLLITFNPSGYLRHRQEITVAAHGSPQRG